MDPVFFSRLAAALKHPGVGFEHVSGSPLQRFLLRAWDTEFKDAKGNMIPMLCTYSDPAIAKLANIVLKIKVTDRRVRKTWERLGLRKAEVKFWSVEQKRGKIVIGEIRHRQK